MRICNNCVLNENFPSIDFDENGVCNYCHSSKKTETQKAQKDKYEAKFLSLIPQFKGKSTYDCLVAFSGGKDSTYTLHLIKNHYNLNPLAFSFDNWFQSEAALKNIRCVIQKLNIDHITVLPSFKTFREIMRIAISQDLYSPKTLERASTICTTCLSLIRFIGFRLSIERNIPFLVFGLSPGQAPVVTSVFKTNPEMIKKMQNMIYDPLHKQLGDIIKPYFLESYHFNREDFPYSINPLAFSEYNEELMIRTAQNFGWKKPEDTDANSTNCLLNALANQIHLEKFGYNPYTSEIAELVRTGKMSREEGLNRLSSPFPQDQIEYVRNKLDL